MVTGWVALVSCPGLPGFHLGVDPLAPCEGATPKSYIMKPGTTVMSISSIVSSCDDPTEVFEIPRKAFTLRSEFSWHRYQKR